MYRKKSEYESIERRENLHYCNPSFLLESSGFLIVGGLHERSRITFIASFVFLYLWSSV